MSINDLPDSWRDALKPATDNDSFKALQSFLATERKQHRVFPPEGDVFNAFRLTPLDQVKVLILGQDPYHDDGQAHGLCFSVRPGVTCPPSLRNIFRELADDAGVSPPSHGSLESWARQGVLLLNTVLTVRAHEPDSHRRRGWEQFTDHVIQVVNQRQQVAFVLWGNPAQAKRPLIDPRHLIVTSAHPSPLSARRGFFGSKPFSKINTFLSETNQQPINWGIADR
ncbi:MAG: uracil-DNA glycosylase [Planctomycetota bacterium]